MIAAHHHHVKQAGTPFLGRARAPVAKNGVTLRIKLSLNKQIAERGMRPIAGVRRQDHFGIGRQFQHARQAAPMNQGEPPQFNIILR
ncbi:hypothetical protein D3C78_1752110 [compost metagenome]